MAPKRRLVLGLPVAVSLIALITQTGMAGRLAGIDSSRPKLVRSAYVPANSGRPWLVLRNGDILSFSNHGPAPAFRTQPEVYRLDPSGSSASVFWKAPPCIGIDDMVVNHGDVYVTGIARSCLQTTANAAQRHYGGDNDAFIVQLNQSGKILYSSFLGGSGTDGGVSLAVDGKGRVYVVGTTASHDFPLKHAPQKKLKNGISGDFVAKLKPKSGLVYSRFLDSSGVDDHITSVAADEHGSAYVSGWTGSADFPTTRHAFEPNYPVGSFNSAIVAKLGHHGKLVYSTYLGARGGDTVPCDDGCLAVYHGQATVTGFTKSRHFPLRHASQNRYGGGAGAGISIASEDSGIGDAFVTTFTRSGRALVASTYLGGRRSESSTSLALDRAGHIYLGGGTFSVNLPVHLAIQKRYGGDNDSCNNGDGTGCPSGDGFAAELNRHGGIMYSTYLGGKSTDFVERVMTHHRQAYVASYSDSANFPLVPRPAKQHKGHDLVLSRIGWR